MDLNAIERLEVAHLPVVPTVGEIASTVILPRVAILPPLRSVTIQDLADEKIDEAQKLIAEDRRRAVATLARQLADARAKEIEAERIAAEQEVENRQVAYWSGVYDQLYAAFREYALQRGPEQVRLLVLQKRTAELFPSRAQFSQMVLKPTFKDIDEAEIRDKVVNLASLDAEYETKATQILKNAHFALDQERASIRAKYRSLSERAVLEAQNEAALSIGPAPQSSDLNLGQNRSVTVSPVGGRTIGIPGSKSTIDDFVGLAPIPVTDQRERRLSLESQLEIWLKTSGYVRTLARSADNDHTAEFDSWRKKHRLGP